MKPLLILSLSLFLTGALFGQSRKVLIKTKLGNITVMLYDDTPNHRDNFTRLVNGGHFDETLFYRVIKSFVIQGGSSDSRNAFEGKHIGYEKAQNINSEVLEGKIHKKGALCAPRQPDEVNLFRKSDVSQFYIAVGRIYTNEELDIFENNRNVPIKVALKRKIYIPQKAKLAELKKTDAKAFNSLLREIKDEIEFEYVNSNILKFTAEQREAYTTIGGIPDLDGNYTVFGEVTSGMSVVNKINALKTDKNDRPYRDIKMTLEVIQ